MRLEWSTLRRASTYSPSGRFRSPSMVSSSKLMTVFFSYSTFGAGSSAREAAGASSRTSPIIARSRITGPSRTNREFIPPYGQAAPACPALRPPRRGRVAPRRRARRWRRGRRRGLGASVCGLLGRLGCGGLLCVDLHLPCRLDRRLVGRDHLVALTLQGWNGRPLRKDRSDRLRVAVELQEGRLALALVPHEQHAAREVDLGQLPAGELLRLVIGRHRLVDLVRV